MKRIPMLVFMVVALLLTSAALAQDDSQLIEPMDPDMVNPEAHISFPPPVYVVRDNIDIRGTVTLATMRNFFIEVRPLALDAMMEGDDAAQSQWFPATLPQNQAVADDVLGSWNTVTQPDGLYELRLIVHTGGDAPEYYRVSPIRIENDAPMAAAEPQGAAIDEPPAQPADEEPAQPADEAPADEAPAVEPPQQPAEPQPEPTADPRPRVIATVNANVRAGDSTQYAVIGHLLEGDSALVKGVSAYGTGWYYIELAGGRSGFIYPYIVNTEGDFDALPRINPPPLPPTPIPVPTAVPQPTTHVDLVMDRVQIHPHGVKCGQTYEVRVWVRNAGSGPATNGGIVIVRDSGNNGSAQPQTTEIAFGPLNAGATHEVWGNITPTIHVETLHHVNLHLDGHNQVLEFNEGNNQHATAPYFLQGGC